MSDDLFTDDDVTAGAEPIWVDWCNHPSGCDCKARALETGRRAVAAVAESIWQRGYDALSTCGHPRGTCLCNVRVVEPPDDFTMDGNDE